MYTVIEDYDPVEPNDIALKVGDKFNKVKEIGNGWAIGTNQTTGETGVFPQNCVRQEGTMEIAGDMIRRMTRKRKSKTSLKFDKHSLTVTEGDENTAANQDGGYNGPSKSAKLTDVPEGSEEGNNLDTSNVDPVIAMSLENADDTEDDKIMETELTEDEDNDTDSDVVDETGSVPSNKMKVVKLHRADNAKVLTTKQKLLNTKRGEFEMMKSILGAIMGLFAGAGLFVMLAFLFKIDYAIAGYISAGFTLLSCIGLATSVHARCTALLMLPSLATGKGRAALMSIIFGLLLVGPISNIASNASAISESMACSTELIYNQSQALRQQLQEPVNAIREKVEASATALKTAGEEIQKAWQPIKDSLGAINSGIQSVSNALNSAATECKNAFTNAYDKCSGDLNDAKSKCKNVFGKIPFRRRRSSEAEAILKRYKHLYLALKYSNKYRNRYRRALSDICNVFDISKVCDGLLSLKSVCNPLEALDNSITDVANKANEEIQKIQNWFAFDIKKELGLTGLSNFTKSAAEFISQVKSDLDLKLVWVFFSTDLVSKLLALTLLLLILQAFHYLKKYLSQDEYNNIYITSFFKLYDQQRRKEGKPHVLPLTKKEKAEYVDTLSLRMGKREVTNTGIGMVQIVLHGLIVMVVIFFDFILFFCLAVVARYSQINISVSGASSIVFEITGTGFIARTLQSFIEGINLQNSYQADYNITTCLPNPSTPSHNDQGVAYIILYALAIISVVMESYSMRLRRKICAFFYPEQERDRVIYLHRKIRHNRKAAQMKVESYRKIMKS